MFETESEVMASLSYLKELEQDHDSDSDIYCGNTSSEAAGGGDAEDASYGDNEESPDTDANNDSGTSINFTVVR